ncbi:hypothetical protein OG247_43985 (plasmid) [Streptomyces sp. NBC_01244]|nr:hypothetical protein OG247_43985 [Streptomyces sp. NBC_01244]
MTSPTPPHPPTGPRELMLGTHPPEFMLQSSIQHEPDKTLMEIVDLRSGQTVWGDLFDSDDVKGQLHHTGNALAATRSPDEVWDSERLRLAADGTPNLVFEECRVCGRTLARHRRITLRVARLQDRPGRPERILEHLVIACEESELPR